MDRAAEFHEVHNIRKLRLIFSIRVGRLNDVTLIYTTHARLRMRQRGIRARDIEATVHAPNRVTNSFGSRLVAQRDVGGRTLEVVYKRLNHTVVVITVYWLEEGV